MKIHSKTIFRQRRKDLRNNATPQEIILWFRLKNPNIGHKFQRQHSIGPYITGFYCPGIRLIIELDGIGHNDKEAKLYDADRTHYFDALNLRVIRFWNNEVDTNIEEVLEKIKKCLDSPKPRFR